MRSENVTRTDVMTHVISSHENQNKIIIFLNLATREIAAQKQHCGHKSLTKAIQIQQQALISSIVLVLVSHTSDAIYQPAVIILYCKKKRLTFNLNNANVYVCAHTCILPG